MEFLDRLRSSAFGREIEAEAERVSSRRSRRLEAACELAALIAEREAKVPAMVAEEERLGAELRKTIDAAAVRLTNAQLELANYSGGMDSRVRALEAELLSTADVRLAANGVLANAIEALHWHLHAHAFPSDLAQQEESMRNLKATGVRPDPDEHLRSGVGLSPAQQLHALEEAHRLRAAVAPLLARMEEAGATLKMLRVSEPEDLEAELAKLVALLPSACPCGADFGGHQAGLRKALAAAA